MGFKEYIASEKKSKTIESCDKSQKKYSIKESEVKNVISKFGVFDYSNSKENMNEAINLIQELIQCENAEANKFTKLLFQILPKLSDAVLKPVNEIKDQTLIRKTIQTDEEEEDAKEIKTGREMADESCKKSTKENFTFSHASDILDGMEEPEMVKLNLEGRVETPRSKLSNVAAHAHDILG